MRNKLRKLIAFSYTDWLMLSYIYALFLLMQFGFRFLSFSTMIKLISMKHSKARSIAGNYPQRELYLVDIAAKYTLFQVTCLKKSFVLFHLWKRRGKRPVLRIGIQKNTTFEAHAWVEVTGKPVLDSEARTANFRQILQLA